MFILAGMETDDKDVFSYEDEVINNIHPILIYEDKDSNIKLITSVINCVSHSYRLKFQHCCYCRMHKLVRG